MISNVEQLIDIGFSALKQNKLLEATNSFALAQECFNHYFDSENNIHSYKKASIYFKKAKQQLDKQVNKLRSQNHLEQDQQIEHIIGIFNIISNKIHSELMEMSLSQARIIGETFKQAIDKFNADLNTVTYSSTKYRKKVSSIKKLFGNYQDALEISYEAAQEINDKTHETNVLFKLKEAWEQMGDFYTDESEKAINNSDILSNLNASYRAYHSAILCSEKISKTNPSINPLYMSALRMLDAMITLYSSEQNVLKTEESCNTLLTNYSRFETLQDCYQQLTLSEKIEVQCYQFNAYDKLAKHDNSHIVIAKEIGQAVLDNWEAANIAEDSVLIIDKNKILAFFEQHPDANELVHDSCSLLNNHLQQSDTNSDLNANSDTESNESSTEPQLEVAQILQNLNTITTLEPAQHIGGHQVQDAAIMPITDSSSSSSSSAVSSEAQLAMLSSQLIALGQIEVTYNAQFAELQIQISEQEKSIEMLTHDISTCQQENDILEIPLTELLVAKDLLLLSINKIKSSLLACPFTLEQLQNQMAELDSKQANYNEIALQRISRRIVQLKSEISQISHQVNNLHDLNKRKGHIENELAKETARLKAHTQKLLDLIAINDKINSDSELVFIAQLKKCIDKHFENIKNVKQEIQTYENSQMTKLSLEQELAEAESVLNLSEQIKQVHAGLEKYKTLEYHQTQLKSLEREINEQYAKLKPNHLKILLLKEKLKSAKESLSKLFEKSSLLQFDLSKTKTDIVDLENRKKELSSVSGQESLSNELNGNSSVNLLDSTNSRISKTTTSNQRGAPIVTAFTREINQNCGSAQKARSEIRASNRATMN